MSAWRFGPTARSIIYETDSLLGSGAPRLTSSLRGLGGAQGEGVAITDSGQVWLSSEGEGRFDQPMFARLTCPGH